MKKNIFHIIVASLLCSTSVSAKTPDDLATVFFDNLSVKPEKALDDLLASNPSIKPDENQVTSLKALLKNYPNIHGQYTFSERLCSYSIGEHIKRLTYIVGYEKSPMMFDLTFYNGGNDWQLYNIDTDSVDIKAIVQNKALCDVNKEN
ncbi:hypothetical protein L1D34_29700 [Vibrio mediterranei]|uniref:hypothetical protein n=1 Tax=Vibrio mediterranei TaxID=689 RepID=UPI001EFD5F59|nr:hypothetical protein [Vibrio mediterranei]MCG9628982.1 hypothetical protein [Vibrio mediterranei]